MRTVLSFLIIAGIFTASCSKCQKCAFDADGNGEVKDSELRSYCGDEEIKKFKDEAKSINAKYVCITD